jgi:hypothetical protein
VRHLSDGALRRLYDEPFALDERTRAHYRGCPSCQERFAAVAEEARHTGALLAVPAATVDPAGALAKVRTRTGPAPTRLGALGAAWRRPAPGGWRRPAFGGVAVVGLAAALLFTLSFTSVAANVVKIFQPTQVQPVTISQGDLAGLDTFSRWGDVTWNKKPELTEAESAAEAARVSGLPVIRVDQRNLPSGLAGAPVSYAAVSQSSGRVTFNREAPSKLRGSTLTVVVGPAETAIYGDLGRAIQSARAQGAQAGDGAAAPGDEAARKAAAAQRQEAAKNALAQAGPLLAVAEVKAPQVSSTGASVEDIKKALLAQPGLSPAVREAIRSINDPAGNLPLPLPAGEVNSHSVRVQGVNGTAVGDNTGLGAAVIWIKHGRVYGVAGTVTEDQLLKVANGLT